MKLVEASRLAATTTATIGGTVGMLAVLPVLPVLPATVITNCIIAGICGYGTGSITDDVFMILEGPVRTFSLNKSIRLEKRAIYLAELSKRCYEASEELDDEASEVLSAAEIARKEIAKRQAARAAKKAARKAKVAETTGKISKVAKKVTRRKPKAKVAADADFAEAEATATA